MAKRSKATLEESWPEMREETRLLSEIHPYPNNPRSHPPEQIAMLARLLTKYGPDQRIVVDEKSVILKGHGRRESALLAGMKEFPVVVRFGLSEAEKRAMRIEDNQSALLSGWNMELLRGEAMSLKTAGYDLRLLGFNENLVSWATAGELVGDAAREWAGMPQFDQTDKTAFRSIVVHFKDQKAVDQFKKKLGVTFSESARFLHYPHVEIESFKDKRYSAAKR